MTELVVVLFYWGDSMLIACSRCGGIHERGDCKIQDGYSERRIRKRGEVERFRSSALWQRKRKKILDRDKHLCRVCLDGKYVPKAITNQRLEVHHIVPIVENEKLKLADDNLISICAFCHVLAEKGNVPRDYLFGLVKTPPSGSLR